MKKPVKRNPHPIESIPTDGRDPRLSQAELRDVRGGDGTTYDETHGSTTGIRHWPV